MLVSDIGMVEFISKSSAAGIVNVMLGFEPDFAILIADHGGTNPNVYLWANNATMSGWAAALSLLITGSTGVITRDTSGIAVYAGGDKVSADESDDTAGKHVDNTGAALTNATAVPVITQAGLAIPADHQVASGRNLLVAFRRNV